MSRRHVVVDGSNIATEGRSLPSLTQLDQAVREFMSEHPDDVVTVVVDASFGHRVDPAELPMFEEAETAGEVVSPPAGAIGRGDAFLLRIAEKIGATVLSNDSFQEFHVEHPWLFDKGRLVGGKPVPGVGWIFMERTPVRGQKSREVTKEAKRKKKAETSGTPGGLEAVAAKGKPRDKKVDRAIARATEEAVKPVDAQRSRRRRPGAPPAEPVNDPLPFITFIAAHPLGTEVAGTVAEFSSHGAFVDAFGARCYVPLSAMGDPPPRRAREVVSKGEERTFVVQAFDPQRRGIELAIPGFERVAGGPTQETVEAEIHPVPLKKARKAAATKAPAKKGAGKRAPAKKAAAAKAGGEKSAATQAPATQAPATKAPATKAPATKAAAGKAPAKKLVAKKSLATTTATPAKLPAPAKAPAPTKAPGAKTAAKKAPAKKAAAPAKKAAAPAKKAAAQAKKAAAPSKNAAAPSKKAAAPAKKPAATGAPAGPEAPATGRSAKKAPAKKAPADNQLAAQAASQVADKGTPTKSRATRKRPAKSTPPA